MAITTQRVYYAGDARDLLPSDSTEETTRADIGSVEVDQSQKFTVAVAGIPNAAKNTAIAALTAALVTALDAFITTTLGIDVAGNTVQYNYKVTKVARGQNANDIFLDEASDSYFVQGEIQIAVS